MIHATQDLLQKVGRIRLLVLDVDGVLTDGRLQYDAEGREGKSFHTRDGYGMRQLMDAGIPVAVVSGRPSRAAATRMAELGVEHVYLGCNDKLGALRKLSATLGIGLGQIACVGDDLPDLPMLEAAGLAIAVADAHPEILARADWRTGLGGGRGAVREVCDLLLAAHRSDSRPPP